MVSDAARRELFVALERELGEVPAATMMELLPPVGWSDVARQSDLVALRGEMAELRGEMAELRAELKGEMAELRAELKGEMAELRTDLTNDMARLRTELKGEMAELRGRVVAQPTRMFAAYMGSSVALSALVLAAAKLA
jgi:hypothetical protein